MRVAGKLTLAYSIIIALPIIAMGIYISAGTTQSMIHQAELLTKQGLLQEREIVNQKIESMNRTSESIAYNSKILEFIENPFENNLQGFENYTYTFAPLFENYIIQNKYIYYTMLYINNASFPDDWNGIFQMNKLENEQWHRGFMEDNSLLERWSAIHDSKTNKVDGDLVREKVFSLYRKLISFKNRSCIGILEIEIPGKTLFENLKKDKDILSYYMVFDSQGNTVYDNTHIDMPEEYKAGFISSLSNKDPNGVFTFKNDQFVSYSTPLDSIGCRLVAITPLKILMEDNPNYKVISIGVIFITLVLFGIIIYLVTNHLTRRLKIMVKGLKSVRDENINIKLQVKNHDELGELAESFNHMTDRIHDLIERVYKSQIMEKESELKALEAQINPHFLYNALSTISWMARKISAENIDNLSFQLSKFYRLVLSKGNSYITVEDEINLLKAYVEIEKIRFENMFHVEYDLDKEALSFKMIKIILQPIAENTINHGIAPKDSKGTMVVRLRQDEENLYFTMVDDGVGMSKDTLDIINRGHIIRKRESGYAIHNIVERLKSVYGENAQVTIISRPGIGCSVNITIPKLPMFPNF